MKHSTIRSDFENVSEYGGPGRGGPGGGPGRGAPFGGGGYGGPPPPPPRGFRGRPPRYGRGCSGCGCLTLIIPAALISIIILISIFA